MRIVHVTDVYLPQVGGIEIFVDDLARRQAAAGHDVTVLAPASRTPLPGADESLTVARAGSAWFPSAARQALRQGDFDLVHVHLSVFSPFSTLVARSASAVGTPIVNTVHSMWKDHAAIVRAVGRFAGWDSWPAAWTAVSSAAAADVRRVLPRDQPVSVVPNAVDVEWWRAPAEGSFRQTEGTPLTLLSVMRLAGRKRPLQLLETLAAMRRLVPEQTPLRAVIVGDGPLRERMLDEAGRLGIADWLSMPGQLTRPEIRELHRGGGVYVAPAHQESFGIAALEARTAGLPVVAMRSGGVVDFVRHEVEGLLCHDDRDMAHALARLATDVQLRRTIEQHNAQVAPALDWADVLARFEGVYAEATEALAARRPSRTTAIRDRSIHAPSAIPSRSQRPATARRR